MENIVPIRTWNTLYNSSTHFTPLSTVVLGLDGNAAADLENDWKMETADFSANDTNWEFEISLLVVIQQTHFCSVHQSLPNACQVEIRANTVRNWFVQF